MTKNKTHLQIKRVKSIDILRGISMILMILAHTNVYWQKPSDLWVISFIFIVLNISGTSQFNFVSGISFAYSWQIMRFNKVDEAEIMKRSLSRTYIMLFISFAYNLTGTLINGYGIPGLWFWSILQCIAISRLITTFLMKYSKQIRMMIAIIMVPIVGLLQHWVLNSNGSNDFTQIIFYLGFNPYHADSVLVFLPFFLVGTVVGQYISEHYNSIKTNLKDLNIQNQDTEEHLETEYLIKLNKSLIRTPIKLGLLFGFVICITGIIIGLSPSPPNKDFNDLVNTINLNPSWKLSSLPYFLTPNTYAWSYYAMGWHLILTCIIFWLVDVRQRELKFWKMANDIGIFSLTIYLTHYIFLVVPVLIIPRFQTNYITIWPAFSIFIFLIWWFSTFLSKKKSGMYSFEFLIKFYADRLVKRNHKYSRFRKFKTIKKNKKKY